MNEIIEKEKVIVENIIYEIKGKQVMLDTDLAILYETETKRNINWMETAMLANGCSEVTLVDAESEILLVSRR